LADQISARHEGPLLVFWQLVWTQEPHSVNGRLRQRTGLDVESRVGWHYPSLDALNITSA